MTMPFSREELIAEAAVGVRRDYLPFFGHQGPPNQVGPFVLSQWRPAPFTVAGVRYPTAEHWMMAEKARLFGDESAREQILASTSPAFAKGLGRNVQGFDEAFWAAHRFNVVVDGSLAKFRQNPELRRYLLTTIGRVLVEAAPRDIVWGVGLVADHPSISRPDRWRGENLLGFALMKTRYILATGD